MHGWLVEQDKFTADNLRPHDFKFRTLLDIGVGYGTTSLYEAFPDSHIVMIDPHPLLPTKRPHTSATLSLKHS